MPLARNSMVVRVTHVGHVGVVRGVPPPVPPRERVKPGNARRAHTYCSRRRRDSSFCGRGHGLADRASRLEGRQPNRESGRVRVRTRHSCVHRGSDSGGAARSSSVRRAARYVCAGGVKSCRFHIKSQRPAGSPLPTENPRGDLNLSLSFEEGRLSAAGYRSRSF